MRPYQPVMGVLVVNREHKGQIIAGYQLQSAVTRRQRRKGPEGRSATVICRDILSSAASDVRKED
jgi:hypothetical protein